MEGATRRQFVGMGIGTATAALGAASMAMAEEAAEQADQFDMEYDVVVIGLGAAGACSAIEADNAGAKVVVLEKNPEDAHWSNTRLSGGEFHSPDPDSDRAARVEYIKAMMSGENCPWKLEGEQDPKFSQEMAEMFADGIMEVKDFLIEQANGDLDESLMSPNGDASFPMFPSFAEAKYGATKLVRYKNWPENEGHSLNQDLPRLNKICGEAFHWALVEDGLKGKHPNVDILFETPATEFITNNGEVIGVVATQGDKKVRIAAKRGVVLCSGGFEYNLPMRRAFLEGPGVSGWGFYGTQSNTGDGIAMAMKIGCGLAKVGKAASRIEVAVPYGEHWESDGLKQGIASNITSDPNSMVVDNYGKRYDDESIITDSTRPYRYQFYKEAVHYDMINMCYPRVPSWLIFDEALRSSKCAVKTDYSVFAFGLIPWGYDNQEAIDNGWILKADTLEELAELIIADPENREMMTPEQLVESVNQYNEFCNAGEDSEFGRDPSTMGPVVTPPFYAMKLYPGGPNTKGGIEANAKRQAIDWEGNPIPRLYTAGEISSVFKFTYQAGGNLTECVVCGRVAGQNVAAEQPWE